MIRQLFVLLTLGLNFTLCVLAQSVPLYTVTVVERTVKAVNYQYRKGPTPIDFRGTVLLPESKGDAAVESKAGRTEIDASFTHVPSPRRFGTEYLTYVLWAITPEGHPKNLGEIIPGSSDKAKTHVTTDLQTFGLIVTAEPYAAVRQPSDVVVMENEVRPDTLGSIEPIQVRYELMPRHAYTYDKPADLAAADGAGPKVSMGEYETLLELYQAKNAIQIAQASGAGQYAAEVLNKAQDQLQNAQSLHDRKGDKSLIISAARQASQTAEDARALASQRAKDAEVAKARGDAEHERQLRLSAEAQAAQAKQQSAQAEAQARAIQAQASADRMQFNQMSQTQAAPVQPAPVQTAPAQPPVDISSLRPPPPDQQTQRNARAALAQRLNGYFASRDTPRGLVATISNSEFHGTALDGRAQASLAQVASAVAAYPGLMVEVEGNSDSAAPEAELLATARAEATRDVLIRNGLPAGSVTARGYGNSRPLGPNSSVQAREANRRVEIVISGGPIGNVAVWDRSYSLVPRR